MGKTYFNHGITGNGRLLITFTDKGEMNRVFWPSPDYYQQINNIHVGIKFDESDTKFLHENMWYVEQAYEPGTNILITKYENSDMGIKILQKDFVLSDSDTLVRNYKIENTTERNMNIKFFLHTDFTSDKMNIRNGFIDFDDECAVIYNKECAVSIGTDLNISGFQFGNAGEAVCKDTLYGKDDISMTSDMGIKWEPEEVKSKGSIEINLFFTFSKEINSSIKLFKEIRQEKSSYLIKKTQEHWKEYFSKLKEVKTGNDKVDEVYRQTLLSFALFTDKNTGGILAGVEVDEEFTRCGRYGYCWPRDGVFITKSFDICGMTDTAEKFYTVWAKKAQLPNGGWQQRYFLDGTLAPSWGIQVDETAAIIYGIWEHYAYTKKIGFLEEMWESVKRGADFLTKFIDEESRLPKASYDLWEERLGEHTYSAAATVGALRSAAMIAEELKVDTPLNECWKKRAEEIKDSISTKLWCEPEKRFLRGIRTRLNWWNCETVELNVNKLNYKIPVAERDPAVDISLLGLAVPFNVFDVKDDKIKKTVRAIEERLDGFPSGGYGRYEYDSYIGGNPWTIAVLWLALYYIESGDTEKGKELFLWTAKHSTNLGFLPEQIDKFSGNPAWIMQLSWSGAMFIIVMDKLRKR